ncbi:DUF1878 family protein [Virgibacillus kekensis]|uniref:DUF1878 family protein n=1 Tax=Virgibacillus kekensis TaxID=202261 RepID=A0ABV9DLE4_9BACI
MKQFEESETTTFHMQMLSKIIDMDRYPLTKLVIEKNLSKYEFEEMISLLEGLQKKYKGQKEEGLLDFSGLLVHFAGMLNEKLEPTSTIYALKKEGYYPSLMSEFLEVLTRK